MARILAVSALLVVALLVLLPGVRAAANPDSYQAALERRYSTPHSLGESYQFNSRDGWETVNVTDLAYKYARAEPEEELEPEDEEEDEHSPSIEHHKRSSKLSKKKTVGKLSKKSSKLSKKSTKKSLSKKSSSKKSTSAKSKKSSSKSISSLTSASGLTGSLKSIINSMTATGSAEPVTITWYACFHSCVMPQSSLHYDQVYGP